MKNLSLLFIAFLFLSSVTLAGFSLKLSMDITGEQEQTFLNHNLETNLKLELPSHVSNPGEMGSFMKGMWVLGLLADVAFPFGDDFKHVAGTGYSIHAIASYAVAAQVLISLRAGYQVFGGQTSEDEYGSYEDDYYQIPFLLSAYFLLGRGAFNPYIGLALGIYLTYRSMKYTYYNSPLPGQSQTIESDPSQTGLGVSPEVGFYYWMAATTMIQVAVAYHYLYWVGGDFGVSYLAIMAGVSFALGGD